MAKKKNATTRILIFAGVLLGALILFAVVAKATGMIGGEGEGREVEGTAASVRAITQVVTASGRIQPEIEVQISPEVSGEIIDPRL